MKILHTVEFYDPSVGGAQEVVRQLSEHLALLGHDVTVATTKLPYRQSNMINGVKIVEFDVGGNQVRGYTGKDIKKYQKYLIYSKFDVIMNYAAQQWTADLAFEVIDKIKGKKVFVPCGYSGLYDPTYKMYFKNLPPILKKYDYAVYLSNDYRDINFAKKNKLKNSVVIPNGADEREFGTLPNINKKVFLKNYGIPEKNQIVLCVSNHTGQKGHKEAISSFKQSNIRDASLVFIGDINEHGGCYNNCSSSAKLSKITNMFVRNNKTIHSLNISRSDTIKFYVVCDIFLFLSNIECSPLVLFESAAAGKPFIASDCGNSKEISKWTEAGLIAKSIKNKNGYTLANTQQASKLLERLLSSEKLRNKLGSSGRKKWRKLFTWTRITKQYEKLYKGGE